MPALAAYRRFLPLPAILRRVVHCNVDFAESVAIDPEQTWLESSIDQAMAQHHLPAIYPYRFLVIDGGLMSYGPDYVHQYQLAAGSHPQGRETRRPSGAGADQVSVDDQPQDCEGTRPHRADDTASQR
jgi:hypothetical protein